MQDVTNPVSLSFNACMIFLSPLTVCNTSLFLTWSIQLIFSILFKHHTLKHSRYFWPTFLRVHVAAPYKAMLKMCILLVSSLHIRPICCWKESSSFKCCLCHGNNGFNFMRASHIICYHGTQAEILHILQLFLICCTCIGDRCLKIVITELFSTFIYIAQHLPISKSLHI